MNKKFLNPTATEFIKNRNFNFNCITPLRVDASNRKYYRIKKENRNLILMDSSLEKSSMKNFIKVSEWLLSNKFSAPKVYEKDLSKGICLIEDFGNSKFNNVFKNNESKKDVLYRHTIDLLKELSKIPCANYLTNYSYKIFNSELDIFLNWYFFFKTKKDSSFINEWNLIWGDYYKVLKKSKLKTTVLRDFHIDNLFFLENRVGIKKIGLIDFQDALYGHYCYDLVSLLQDVRTFIPFNKQKFLYNYYLSINNISEKNFEDSYFIFGTQRLLKILGIFNRLKHRDKKNKYFKYIPRTLKLIKRNLDYPYMSELKNLLKNFNCHDFSN